jgi:hypothetical protein
MVVNAIDVITHISSGYLDDSLDEISTAIKARHNYTSRMQALRNQAEFVAGTPVVISGNISPRYLLGVTGVVAERTTRRPGDIAVDLDPGQRTGRYSSTRLDIPAGCLEARRFATT